MKITQVESWLINIPYKCEEKSALVARSGVTDLIVRITTDNGLIGWGESTRVADPCGIEAAVKAMTPILLGRSPWDREAICRDVYDHGPWLFQEMTANLAYAGVPLSSSAQFVIAINNYRQSGGGNFPHVKTAPVVYNRQIEIRQMLIDWVTANKVIDPSTFSSLDWKLVSNGTPITVTG